MILVLFYNSEQKNLGGKMKLYKPPEIIPYNISSQSLFLAGSIEMGTAEQWQKHVEQLMHNTTWTLFNPRRDDWDSTWVQSIENPQFREQVEWELSALERATRVLMYFAPGSYSPISLLELGLFGKSYKKMVVVCSKAFWRKGNVDIVCHRYGIPQAKTLEEAVSIILDKNNSSK